MEIVSMRDYQGRNIYSHKPVIRMTVDLGYLSNRFTKELPGFNEKLLEFFPGLNKHYCSPGYPGGFVERLQEGTLVSHVTEHLAIELQCLMGYDVYFGKTRVFQEPDLYHIIYEYINQACAMNFGYAAAKIVLALVSGESDSIEAILRQLQLLR
jgi:cyanophycin synthetase